MKIESKKEPLETFSKRLRSLVFGAARESAPATIEKSIHKTIEGDREKEKTKR
jgi:hypothetical protein